MPVVVASVLPELVAVTVPPPVAENAVWVPVEAVILPVMVIVAPVLLVSEMPVPVSPIAPETVIVPPLRLAIESECATDVVIAAPSAIVPLPPLMLRPLPVVLLITSLESSVNALIPVAVIPAPEDYR